MPHQAINPPANHVYKLSNPKKPTHKATSKHPNPPFLGVKKPYPKTSHPNPSTSSSSFKKNQVPNLGWIHPSDVQLVNRIQSLNAASVGGFFWGEVTKTVTTVSPRVKRLLFEGSKHLKRASKLSISFLFEDPAMNRLQTHHDLSKNDAHLGSLEDCESETVVSENSRRGVYGQIYGQNILVVPRL